MVNKQSKNTKKDARMHLVIKKAGIQKLLQRVMEDEDLSHEELIAKYMLPHLPEKSEGRAERHYKEMSDLIIKLMSNSEERTRLLKKIFAQNWSALVLITKGKIDPEKFNENLGSLIESYVKNKGGK